MLQISVVIPIYNAEKFLKETIDSVLNQTFNDFEIILADNLSTDRSKDIVFSYKDPRIRYVSCNTDIIGTYQKAYELSKGKYIAHLDQDGMMVPERLQIQCNFMESHPIIDACSAYMSEFGKCNCSMKTKYVKHEDLSELMILKMPFFNSAAFFKKEFLKTNNIRHQQGYSVAFDFKFFSDIAKVGKLGNIPEILVYYAISDANTSVEYHKRYNEASFKVQNEMLEFFLSKLKIDSDLTNVITKDLIHSIKKLREDDFFSNNLYFRFIYELINGLRRKKGIRL